MTEYHQGKYGFKTLENENFITKTTYTDFIKKLQKLTSVCFLYRKDSKNETNTRALFKVLTYADLDNIRSILSGSTKDNNKFDIKVGSKTIRFQKTGGRLKNVFDENGVSKSEKSPSTAQQEDGVVHCLNNNEYDPEKIRTAIGFNFQKTWLNSFQKTFKAISSKFDCTKYTTYRDSDSKKPKYLSDMVASDVIPDKKDNWNPADIWMVSKTFNKTELVKTINSIKKGDLTYIALNTLIKKYLQNKSLIGISLKQVTSSKATMKLIEVNTDYIKNLKYDGIYKIPDMSVLNSYFDIYIKIKEGLNIKKYMIRSRPKGKSGSIKVFFEGKAPDRKTFDGAVSKQMLVNTLFKGRLKSFEKIMTNIDFSKISDTLSARSVLQYIISESNSEEYKKFLSFLIKNDFINITDIDKPEKNTYFIQRGLVNAYVVFMIHNSDVKKTFKMIVLSSMKMNEFSSMHYKVY